MKELAPGIHSLGHAKGGHVHAFLIEDGNELTLVDTLFESNARPDIKLVQTIAGHANAAVT